MNILRLDKISLRFGGIKAVDGVSLTVEPGRVFAIIGPNGAGKTTLFNIISGLYHPDIGTVKLLGEDIVGLRPFELAARGLARTFQNLQIFTRMTAVENVMVGRHLRESKNIFAHMLALPYIGRENAESRASAMEYLAYAGLQSYANSVAGTLSYGMLKRLEISRTLASEPKILLLDEPAAGCNPVETIEIDRLIRRIADSGITVILVEHDMRLVMRISDRIHVLDHGRTIAEGEPQEVRSHPEVIRAYLGHVPNNTSVGNA